ncbi:MAG: hypothetical protein N2381_07565 [Armatimonadetes bacterium]|nr:hypothetical protein [Armatimonadota bacterium]MCX7777896.1 hypothetical protein [Armatimonadota bacterium]
MSTAYTPGLIVTRDTIIRKERRLPVRGKVLVNIGDEVLPTDVIAQAELLGPLTTVRVADRLGVEPRVLLQVMRKRVGESVQKGEVLAESRSFFGLLKAQVESPVDGTIEFVSDVTGNVGIRHPPTPIQVLAYIRGIVTDVIEGEGAVVETRGALIQGIFGIGGEAVGEIAIVANSPDEDVSPSRLEDVHRGKVLVCGSIARYEFLKAAQEVGAVGIVTGGILDSDLASLLGYEIGVAITGQEEVGLTIIVTEGFGVMPMAKRTFELLCSLSGMEASISGATQIRAGVIRPEIIVPIEALKGTAPPKPSKVIVGILEVGSRVRIIREPYFGELATVVELPPEPQVIETGSKVRVLKARLDSGEVVTIPRANVELIEE